MYERDNVAAREMLNLSDHSHTPTSFRMTSPIFEGKQHQANTTLGGNSSIVGRDATYSRYELKMLEADSAHNGN